MFFNIVTISKNIKNIGSQTNIKLLLAKKKTKLILNISLANKLLLETILI